MRELSSLIGMQAIAIDEGKRLGSIARALVDLAAGELVAVMVSREGEERIILARDFKVLGQDALMVASAGVLKSPGEVAEELARGRDVLADPPTVLTDKGTRLGMLSGVLLAEDGRTVLRYNISGGPLRDVTSGPVALPVLKGTVHGVDTVIVPHEVAHKYLAATAGGIKGGLEKLGRIFRHKYSSLSERSGELLRETEERLRSGGAKARQRAGELLEEAREKLKEVSAAEEKAGEVAPAGDAGAKEVAGGAGPEEAAAEEGDGPAEGEGAGAGDGAAAGNGPADANDEAKQE